jgi:hypothetical protein
MRAFVEVDPTVQHTCLAAGVTLKREFAKRCHIQLCVFAQNPLFSYASSAQSDEMQRLFVEAARHELVDVVGSTPYVEKGQAERNVEWMVDLAVKEGKMLDFHLDYNLDPNIAPLVYHVIDTLHAHGRKLKVTLGHCTRLTLFTAQEWHDLKQAIGDLNLSFVGLPTSDLFMMGRPGAEEGGGVRHRGTLQVPTMIEKYGLRAAIAVNNVGNAFTPQGSCDPMGVASLGVAIYQSGTKRDAEILLVRTFFDP